MARSYDETLSFLYTQLPMYQRVGAAAFKKGLGNTRGLLRALGNPEREYPSIHIAGTNGKGTVSHLLAAVLQAAGYRVGLYTSPHYRDFRERIKIDGQMIPKRDVTAFVDRIQGPIADFKPSFFEITVAMAFDAFARHEVDIAVIETGLGGRLDSTNVIKPVLSVITNIGFDHMDMLGDTLPKIAKEKAGIIKKNTPVVIGEWHRESAPVFRRVASKRNAPITFANKTWRMEEVTRTLTTSVFNASRRSGAAIEALEVGSASPFTARNLATALQALNCLGSTTHYKVTADHIRHGLQNIRELTGYKGRWQVLSEDPLVLADSAHNEDAIKEVTKRLAAAGLNMHIVLGAVKGKDLGKLLGYFPVSATYYFVRPDVPRGLDAHELQTIASTFGLQGKTYSSVRRGLAAARRAAQNGELVFVGGSSFVVAEVV